MLKETPAEKAPRVLCVRRLRDTGTSSRGRRRFDSSLASSPLSFLFKNSLYLCYVFESANELPCLLILLCEPVWPSGKVLGW